MPTRPLNPNRENLQSLKEWLNENLNDKKRIKACCKELSNVPNSKGIYFWFMHPSGYNILNKYIPNFSSLSGKYIKSINDVDYDLVYLGTAGTGKKGNSNLLKRIRWHLCDNYGNSEICHGTISTFRAGVSALLADDLIENNVKDAFDKFVCEYMYIYWLDYSIVNDIDNDEKILIQTIKPLLNIKNNSNARANSIDNNTKKYRERRLLVMKNTRSRIECKKESDKTMSEIAEPTNDAISYNDQIVIEENGCMEYTVSKDQDIAVVTRGIKGLPIGECKIIAVYDSLNPNKYFEEWKFYTTGRNTLNNPEAQNVYTYFANEHNGVRRSFLINKWMIDNNIDEITVKICSK